MNTSIQLTFDSLTCLSMDIIKDVPWAQSMFNSLEAGLKKSFLNWLKVVLTLSQNEEDVIDWKKTYIEQFEERCCEMVSDMQDLHEQVIVKIEEYLNEIQILCKKLQIEMPIFGNQKLGLYQEQLQLKKQLEELKQMSQARQAELDELRRKQLKLCKALGKQPKIIKDNPLPSSSEILDIQIYIEELEQEKFNREEKFYIFKEKINELIQELEYVPSTKFEKDVIFEDESLFLLSESNMESLENFHLMLQKQFDNVRDEIGLIRNKIEHLWTLLDFDFVEREEFRNKHTGNSLKTLEALRKELQKCEKLKKANIKVFVDKLRKELTEIWEQCHCHESIKNEFKYFYSDCYTEDLMELHEVQLEKWRIYAIENGEILSLLNKHKSLWDKMVQLEKSATGVDRYNNRGGKLLKEEKERNLLCKQIPKIESKLLELAELYEQRHGLPFLTFGKTVNDYINDLHLDRENAKKLKLSARKAQKETTITPMSNTKCVTSLFSTGTPMTPKRQLECPSTNRKRIKLTPQHSASKRHNQLTVPKILLTSGNCSKRFSIERKKRIEKIRRLSRQSKSKEENNVSYTIFENELSNRVDLRSTVNFIVPGASKMESDNLVNPQSTTSGVNNLTKTPTKVPPSTPRTPRNLKKSPGVNPKLTAAKCDQKLIF